MRFDALLATLGFILVAIIGLITNLVVNDVSIPLVVVLVVLVAVGAWIAWYRAKLQGKKTETKKADVRQVARGGSVIADSPITARVGSEVDDIADGKSFIAGSKLSAGDGAKVERRAEDGGRIIGSDLTVD
ncbi:hypothetical protein HerbRD11066_37610 [Herbidospora sp. RD11066]